MAGKRYDVMVTEDKDGGKQGGGKTFYTKIGSAWEHGDGRGWNIEIKPGLAVSGKLMIREPLERHDDAPRGGRSRRNDNSQDYDAAGDGAGRSGSFGDDIPFMREERG